MLQKQVERFGSHIFKDGAMVIPGHTTYDLFQYYIKIPLTYSGRIFASGDFLNQTLRCITAGNTLNVEATVIDFVPDDVTTPTFYYLYLKYKNSGDSGLATAFASTDLLTVVESSIEVPVLTAAPNPVGIGSVVSIAEGIYFTHGTFVKNDAQKIFLDPENNLPSYRVGLKVIQEIYTEKDDISLTSNATGQPNYTAPGAHRLKIDLILSKIPLGDEDPRSPVVSDPDPDFIELLVIQNGIIYKEIVNSEYSIIEETLARRTFDESGDYTVRPFVIDVKEYLDDAGNNTGVFQKSMNVTVVGGSFDGIVDQVITQGAASATVTYYNPVTGKLKFINTVGVFDSSNGNIIFGANTASINVDVDGYAQIFGQIDGSVSNKTQGAATSQDFSKLIAIGIEPGKAYVKGHEVEQIAKTQVAVRKARDNIFVDNKVIDPVMGNYVIVSDIIGLPNIQVFPQVELYDKNYTKDTIPAIGEEAHHIGSAKVRNIEHITGEPGAADSIYRLYLCNVTLKSGFKFEHVKYICQENAIGTANFTVTPYQNLFKLINKANVEADGPDWTLHGFNSRFLKELVVNDIIVFYPSNALTRAEFVVTAIIDDLTASMETVTIPGGFTGITEQSDYFAKFTPLELPQHNGLVFKFPNTAIYSMNDFLAYTNRVFSNILPVGDIITITTSNQGEFVSNFTNFLVMRDDGVIVEPINIIIDPLLIDDATTVEIQVPAPVSSTYTVIATLKLGSGLNTLTYRSKTLQITTNTISTKDLAEQNIIPLEQVDIYEIVSVNMSADFSTVPSTTDPDIKNRYTLDTGQRDNMYEYGSLIKKSGTAIPIGRLLVTYKYFGHEAPSSSKIFYVADSYPGAIYDSIPTYISSSNGQSYSLQDCLDFRPDVNHLHDIYVPDPGSHVRVDYHYYLNRIDSLYINGKGQFFISEGTPALEPTYPETPSDRMILYNLHVKAYTFTPKDVVPDFIENKRYTMRDIGKLEKRIDNLEYYTNLNELEKQTKSLEILDENGLDRFKHGFIVDSFADAYSIQDRGGSGRSRCSVDILNQELRPEFRSDNVNLIPASVSSGVTETSGGLLTLDYSEVVMIEQPYATTHKINVNPYNVFTYIGFVELDPPLDEWVETKIMPDKIVPGLGNYNSMVQYNNAFGGVHWNDWTTTWVGTKTTIGNKVKWNGVNTAYSLGITTPMYHYSAGGMPITPENIAAGLIPGIPKNSDPNLWAPQVPSANHPYPLTNTTNERWTESTKTTYKTTKTGTKTTIVPVDILKDLGTSVVDVSVVPFIRARDVQVTAKRMKPNTQLYAFFDNVPVSKYMTSTTLKTNNIGEISGIFQIPKGMFKTGQREFRLTDQSDNNSATTTRANTTYIASGTLEKKQKTILSVRNGMTVTEHISDVDYVSSKTVETKEKQILGPWYDPISQTFLIDSDGGAFITSVDVFFAAKDSSIPIELQIREVVNGYPGSTIVPFGRIVKNPSGVSVDPTNAAVATTFTFPSPVYLLDKTEYAICLVSDSNGYEVWVATKTPPVGKDAIKLNEIVTPVSKAGQDLTIEPYSGSFFQSQNSSTWTAIQETDLKFTIRKAQFYNPSTEQIAHGTFQLKNDPDDLQYTVNLSSDPLYIRGDIDSGIMRVYHPNHGMTFGSRVKLSGIEQLLDGTTPVTTITSAISNVDIDSYTINASNLSGFHLAGISTYSGAVGGNNIKAIQDKRFDTMNVIIGDLIYPKTSITYTAQISSYATYLLQSAVDIDSNTNYNRSTPSVVASSLNESGSNGKLFINCTLITENPNVSPVIDVKRFSAILVSNRLNNPTDALNIPSFDDVLIIDNTSNTNAIEFIATTNKIEILCDDEDASTVLYNKLNIGKYIKTTSANHNNQGPFVITKKTKSYDAVADEWYVVLTIGSDLVNEGPDGPPTSLNLIQSDFFVDEVGPENSSTVSKYVTKRMTISNEATALKIQFAAFRDDSTTLELYYIPLKTHETRNFDDIEYTKAEFTSYPPASTRLDEFKDYETIISNIDPFIAVAYKIVMKGTNTSLPPRIKDFRGIALDV
jgi:hypothetical protein